MTKFDVLKDHALEDTEAVNSWTGSPANAVGRDPLGWNDTQNAYNRENTYNEAIQCFL